MQKLTLLLAALSVSLSLTSGVLAKNSKDQNTDKKSAASTSQSAEQNAAAAAPAPQTIILGDKIAKVELPGDYRFIDEEKAVKFMKAEGGTGEGVLGIIAPPKASPDNYFIVCRFEDVGYVKDDDADKLNADEILNSYKEGTAQQNEERKQNGLAPIYVGGWAEKPYYDKALHHVVWAVEVKDADSTSAPVVSVNYNTRILGRKGVLSLNLVTDPKELAKDKLKVNDLLQRTSFIKGQTYAEYVPGTDKSAGYGLAGLILGGGAMAAAAKFGIFGAFWKWGLAMLLVMKKFLIVGLAGLGALISKFFKKKGAKTASGTSSTAGDTATGLAADINPVDKEL